MRWRMVQYHLKKLANTLYRNPVGFLKKTTREYTRLNLLWTQMSYKQDLNAIFDRITNGKETERNMQTLRRSLRARQCHN